MGGGPLPIGCNTDDRRGDLGPAGIGRVPRHTSRSSKNAPEIKGVRQILHAPGTPPGTCRDPKFVDGIRALGETGLMFDLCMRRPSFPTRRN